MRFSRLQGVSPRFDPPMIHFHIQNKVVSLMKKDCLICWMLNSVRISRERAEELGLRYVDKREDSGKELVDKESE
jgi:hypothetical protein